MGRLHALSRLVAGRGTWRPGTATWYVAAAAGLLLEDAHRSLPAVSSVIAAAGLAVLAYTDATRRHLPRTWVRLLPVTVSVALVWHGVLFRDWQPVVRAGLGGVVTAGVVGALWWAVPGGFAFGDVKITTVAVGAAAAVSWPAAAATLALACMAGGVLAAGARVRDRARRPSALRTVPFVPGLLLGFVVGVSLW